jgi:aminoglycoside phosphotransferase
VNKGADTQANLGVADRLQELATKLPEHAELLSEARRVIYLQASILAEINIAMRGTN